MSSTTSICTALTLKHMKISKYMFTSLLPYLIQRCLVKSTSVCLKRTSSSIREVGKLANLVVRTLFGIVLHAQLTRTQDRFYCLSFFGHPVTTTSKFSQGVPNSQVLAPDMANHYDEPSYQVMFSQFDKVFNLTILPHDLITPSLSMTRSRSHNNLGTVLPEGSSKNSNSSGYTCCCIVFMRKMAACLLESTSNCHNILPNLRTKEVILKSFTKEKNFSRGKTLEE